MIIPDAHTPCPACAIQVREACDALVLVLDAITECPEGVLPTELLDVAGAVRYAVDRLMPLVLAHAMNQAHAFSDELAGARHPAVGAAEEAEET